MDVSERSFELNVDALPAGPPIVVLTTAQRSSVRSDDQHSGHLLSYLSPEQRVPADPPLCDARARLQHRSGTQPPWLGAFREGDESPFLGEAERRGDDGTKDCRAEETRQPANACVVPTSMVAVDTAPGFL